MKKNIISALTAFTLFAIICFATATGGTKDDPVMSQDKVETLIETLVLDSVTEKMEAMSPTDEFFAQWLVDNDKISYVLGDTITNITQGDKITVRTGSATLSGTGSLINVSTGAISENPTSLALNTQYIVTEDSNFTVKVTSLSSKINIQGSYKVTPAYNINYESYAQALDYMGLFKGTEYSYELERPATRTEALIMLIRLIGEEDQALLSTAKHPFTDVASWAECYVSYAYEKGYTIGVTDTIFGSDSYVKDLDFYTFLLRVLEYSDDIDFTWLTAQQKAQDFGIIPSTFGTKDPFYRDYIAYTSFSALSVNIKDTEQTLAEKLIENSVFTQTDYTTAKNHVK